MRDDLHLAAEHIKVLTEQIENDQAAFISKGWESRNEARRMIRHSRDFETELREKVKKLDEGRKNVVESMKKEYTTHTYGTFRWIDPKTKTPIAQYCMPGDSVILDAKIAVTFDPDKDRVQLPPQPVPEPAPDHISADHLEGLCNILEGMMYAVVRDKSPEVAVRYSETIQYARERAKTLRRGEKVDR